MAETPPNVDTPLSERFSQTQEIAMLADKQILTDEALFAKWSRNFKDRAEFFRYFGIVDWIYEGSFQQQLAQEYAESLADKYFTELDISAETPRFEEPIFVVEKNIRIRISTSRLPLKQIGLERVTSQYIDLSMDLLERLKPNHLELLKKIVATLISWEAENNRRVKKDGTFFSIREKQ